MAETNQFFENPMRNGSNGNGWTDAIGAFLGAAVGTGGLFGNNGNKGGDAPVIVQPSGVSTEQLNTALGNLQGQLQRDQMERSIGDLGSKIEGVKCSVEHSICDVKDAIRESSAANALAVCNLGHNMSAGFSSVNQSIANEGAKTREMLLQQELDRARSHATELRIELSENRAAASHRETQVLVNQVIASGKQ